jgi:hypothetical protein
VSGAAGLPGHQTGEEVKVKTLRHAVTVDSPIREYYLVGRHDTAHSERWRTEIGWPIFRTSSAALSSPGPRD